MPKKKILLAEDDEDDRHFFVEFLQERHDLELLPIAYDGASLLDYLKQINDHSKLPDVIILDQNMPKVNGLQALERLKSDNKYIHIPVIIYSTYTNESLVQKGSEMGACLVLTKPVTRTEYNKMMNTLIEYCMSV